MIKKLIRLILLVIILGGISVYITRFINNSVEKGELLEKIKGHTNTITNTISNKVQKETEVKPTIDKIELVNKSGDEKNYSFNYNDGEFTAIHRKNNWEIIDSYKIINQKDMEVICQALIDVYPIPSKDYKSNRTAEDMAYEWIQHNIAYTILPENSKYKDNSKDVDFNSEDQGKTFKDFYESRTGKKFDIKDIDYKKYIKYIKDNFYE